MIFQNEMTTMEKLTILSDAAKYDVACTSSGVDKKNNGQGIGNAAACGICHSFSADGRCISLLKILFTNECIFDCKYCINRASNDVVRATFTPEEVCSLTMEFYRRNYIEGLFLSSGIVESPDNTMKLLCETVMLLREKYHFGGYIHLKGIPGASPELIEAAGWYADRMSVNLELPTAEGLKSLAPHKNRKNILTPIRQIQNGIIDNRNQYAIGKAQGYGLHQGNDLNNDYHLHQGAGFRRGDATSQRLGISQGYEASRNLILSESDLNLESPTKKEIITDVRGMDFAVATNNKPKFVPAGQSTQMIIGATPESDFQIVTVAEALYQNYDLKRVFYSAFINVNTDVTLPAQPEGVPMLREHRLYQADWLLRFYGFKSHELLSEDKPNFNVLLDPKCDWAIRHLEQFPVEINRADYYTLLRVPGIGVNSAKRIVKARRSAKLDFSDIKKMGVVLKRALYFITCGGKMMYDTKIEEDYITSNLISIDKRRTFEIGHSNSYKQLSLFDDVRYNIFPDANEGLKALAGQM